MKESIHEIAPDVYRLCVAPSSHFEFAQFLILDEKPTLVHAGKSSLFSPLKNMVEEILQDRELEYIVFSHVEADESGASNLWLEKYPNASIVCNRIANISLDDSLIRAPHVFKDGDRLELGMRSLRLVETPHFPHNWDAHMWYEEKYKILFSSDFCCQGGICEPSVETDISDSIIAFYEKGGFIPYGTTTNSALDKLSQFDINAIVPMHGSSILGPVVSTVFENVRKDLMAKAHVT